MKKRFGVIATIVAAASFFSLITASVAWFEARTDVDFGTGHGSTAASYFESGAGTQASPYVIATQTHMYNFAWLQYLGQFNKISSGTSSTEVSPTYFSLKNDIDMGSFGSALPPIGTQANPFIGIFKGNGNTIKNLTVSNSASDLIKKPSTVQSVTGCEVIGFFGIVGDPSPIDIQKGDGLNYDSLGFFEKLRVANFNLQNVVIKSVSDNALMGVVAGYLNAAHGTVHDIGVFNGSLQAKQGVQAIPHFADSNIISKFSLVGETEDTVWQQAYEEGAGGDGQGDDASFGGSVDMKTLVRRVNYMIGSSQTSLNATSMSGYTAISKSSSNYHLNSVIGSANPYVPFDWQTSDGTTVDLKKNSFMPINIDGVEMGLFNTDGEITTQSQLTSTRTWTYDRSSYSGWGNASLKTNTEYDTYSYERLKNNNTGYFVGSASYSMRLRNQSLAKNPSVPYSLGLTYNSASEPNYTYDASKLELVARDDGGYFRIQDDHNASVSGSTLSSYYSTRKKDTDVGFKNYSKVRDYLGDIFTSGSLYGIRVTSIPSASNTTTANVNLNGINVQDYTLYDGAINFNLKSSGVVTIASGTYATSTGTTTSLGGIYSVDRSGSGVATPVEIQNVYKNSAGDILTNQSSAPAGYTKVYDYQWYNGSLRAGVVYYLEVPLKPGDYLIGRASVGNSSYSGYMLYLDIGANGNGSSGGGDTPVGYYDLKNIRYVHSLTDNTVAGTNYVDILFEITTAGATGEVVIYFARQSSTMLNYYRTTNVNLRVFIATTSNITETESANWNA